jgi:hypothetical protein
MEIFYAADSVRLPDCITNEIRLQMACNHSNNDDDELWFDGANDLPVHMNIVSEAEMFARDDET